VHNQVWSGFTEIGENGFEGGEIAVDVGHDGGAHGFFCLKRHKHGADQAVGDIAGAPGQFPDLAVDGFGEVQLDGSEQFNFPNEYEELQRTGPISVLGLQDDAAGVERGWRFVGTLEGIEVKGASDACERHGIGDGPGQSRRYGSKGRSNVEGAEANFQARAIKTRGLGKTAGAVCTSACATAVRHLWSAEDGFF